MATHDQINDSEFMTFILFIDSFPKIISPVCQPASQANKSGNEPVVTKTWNDLQPPKTT